MGDLQRDARGAGVRWCRDGCRRAVVLLGLAGVLVACGGRPPAAKSPGPEGVGDPGQGAAVSGEPAPAQDPAAQPAPAPGADAVTQADCQGLLAHLVTVANAAHVQTVAPEHAPTEEQLAEIRGRMAPEFMPMCLSLDRATLTCQMRAHTRDELLACAQ